jgi:hypothetical protein
MGELRKSCLLLRGSACPSDNSVRVKSVQLILNIGLCHFAGGKSIPHVGFTYISTGPGSETTLCKRRMSRAVVAVRHRVTI